MPNLSQRIIYYGTKCASPDLLLITLEKSQQIYKHSPLFEYNILKKMVTIMSIDEYTNGAIRSREEDETSENNEAPVSSPTKPVPPPKRRRTKGSQAAFLDGVALQITQDFKTREKRISNLSAAIMTCAAGSARLIFKATPYAFTDWYLPPIERTPKAVVPDNATLKEICDELMVTRVMVSSYDNPRSEDGILDWSVANKLTMYFKGQKNVDFGDL